MERIEQQQDAGPPGGDVVLGPEVEQEEVPCAAFHLYRLRPQAGGDKQRDANSQGSVKPEVSQIPPNNSRNVPNVFCHAEDPSQTDAPAEARSSRSPPAGAIASYQRIIPFGRAMDQRCRRASPRAERGTPK